MTPARCERISVAQFVSTRIDELALKGKTARQIAKEVGYKSPNMISMLKTGRAKVPLEKIPALARALELDVALLLRIALSEYWPDIENVTIEIFGGVFTANERAIVKMFREHTGGSDRRLTAEEARKLTNALEEIC